MALNTFVKPLIPFALVAVWLSPQSALSQSYKTDIPPSITAPDSVETRLGTLKFTDGFPDDATVQKVYDNLDFQRGVQAFLTAMPAASLAAHAQGALRGFGPDNQTVIIFESLMDSRSLFLTANTESIYAMAGSISRTARSSSRARPTRWASWTTSGSTTSRISATPGPTRARAASSCSCRRTTRARCPQGYYVFRSQTFGNWFGDARLSASNGDPKPAVDSIKQHLRIYPLAQAANPPATNFINVSGKAFNTIHCHGLLVLRGSERGHPGGARRRDRSGDARAARLDRHREGQTVRARRAHEEDPHRSGRRRAGDRARARLSARD